MSKLLNLFMFFALFYISIYAIAPDKIQPQAFASEAKDVYTVEVASYLNKKSVLIRISFLKESGYPADFIKLKATQNGGATWYVANLGYYADKKQAENMAKKYKSEFAYQAYIIKSYNIDFLKKRAGVFQLTDISEAEIEKKTQNGIISDIKAETDEIKDTSKKLYMKAPDTSILLNRNKAYIPEIVSYLDKKKALSQVALLRGKGYPADFIKLKAAQNGKIIWYIVHLGYYADKKKAENAAKKYKFDFSNRSYIIKSYDSDFLKKRAGVFESIDKASEKIISDIEIWTDKVDSKTENIKIDLDF